MEKNLLICGDNLKALDDLIKEGVKVDLIYLDPPSLATGIMRLFGGMRRKSEASRTDGKMESMFISNG
jgi:23S rRNA G2069 N7-methylase RlmK/C1962 C5-methylase RlmI